MVRPLILVVTGFFLSFYGLWLLRCGGAPTRCSLLLLSQSTCIGLKDKQNWIFSSDLNVNLLV